MKRVNVGRDDTGFSGFKLYMRLRRTMPHWVNSKYDYIWQRLFWALPSTTGRILRSVREELS